MPNGRTLLDLVDDLLAAPKALAGDPQLRHPNRVNEEVRWRWPVLANGESDSCSVTANLYPNEADLRFSISLTFLAHNIWRLDYEPIHRVEHNPFLLGHKYSLATIAGPHCHPWKENRRLAARGQIPVPLGFRVPLEMPNTHADGSHRWEKVFRHFLGLTNISQPPAVPPWPPQGTLI